jgi:hypothetical protein
MFKQHYDGERADATYAANKTFQKTVPIKTMFPIVFLDRERSYLLSQWIRLATGPKVIFHPL